MRIAAFQMASKFSPINIQLNFFHLLFGSEFLLNQFHLYYNSNVYRVHEFASNFSYQSKYELHCFHTVIDTSVQHQNLDRYDLRSNQCPKSWSAIVEP